MKVFLGCIAIIILFTVSSCSISKRIEFERKNVPNINKIRTHNFSLGEKFVIASKTIEIENSGGVRMVYVRSLKNENVFRAIVSSNKNLKIGEFVKINTVNFYLDHETIAYQETNFLIIEE